MPTLHLCGISVQPDDARMLIGSLTGLGTPAAIAAVEMIAKGFDRELYAVGLDHEMCYAILSVLDDPPDSLVELRGKLARQCLAFTTARSRPTMCGVAAQG